MTLLKENKVNKSGYVFNFTQLAIKPTRCLAHTTQGIVLSFDG
jgi:hypothetical protein